MTSDNSKTIKATSGSIRSVASRAVDRAIERRREVYEKEVTRLVEASFSLIRDTGNLEPKVSEIVKRAGLSNQAFYKHFRSKDELLLAVLDEGSYQLKTYLEHRMEKCEDAKERVLVWLDGMTAQVLNSDAAQATRPFALSRARLSELFPAEVCKSEQQLNCLLREAIAGTIESGDMPNADADRDAEVISHMVLGWIERKLASEPIPQREDVEHLIEFVMNGLCR